jgi:ribose transport system substrate-binding protein
VPQLSTEVVGENLNYLVHKFPEISTMPAGKDLLTLWAPIEGKSIFYAAIFLAHPFVQHLSDVFERMSAERGISYQVVDYAFDPAREIETADLAISRGFDVIYLHPSNPAGLSPSVQRIRDDGRIVMNYDTDTFVRPTIKWGRGFFLDGYLAGKWLADRLPEGAKVVSGVGERITTAGNDRPRGLKQALDEAGKGFELIADEDGHGWTQEGGYDMARAMFQRFPQIDAIFGGDDQGALGMYRAAVDVGRRDDLLIAGVDCLREGQEALVDGRLDVSTCFRRGHGPEAAACMLFTAALMRGNVHGDLTQTCHVFKLLAVDKDTVAQQWQSPV